MGYLKPGFLGCGSAMEKWVGLREIEQGFSLKELAKKCDMYIRTYKSEKISINIFFYSDF